MEQTMNRRSESMTANEMLEGEWKVLIEEIPTNLAQTIEFREGGAFMFGAEVGTIEIAGDVALATVGTNATLRISLPNLAPVLPGVPAPAVNFLQAAMVTEYEDDEPMQEVVSLVRQTADRVSGDELRRRIAEND
jgi:hypothetical protein